MNVKLYTLPTCPICEMVKKKLQDKHIEYDEKPFEEGLNNIFTVETAPVLVVQEEGQDIIFTSPIVINTWIKEQEA